MREAESEIVRRQRTTECEKIDGREESEKGKEKKQSEGKKRK